MSKISYDLKKIKAVVFDVDGVLSPSTVPISPDGTPLRMGNVKDGFALQLAVKKGLKIAVITGGITSVIPKRMAILGIHDVFQGASDKLPVLKKWMTENNLTQEEVAYMGDDIPDLPCLRYVGLSAAPYDAAREVRETAVFISKFSGGYGAARDLLQEILMAQDSWLSSEEVLVW